MAGQSEVPSSAVMIGEPAAREAQPDDFWQVDAIVTRLGGIRRDWRSNRAHHAEYGIEGFPSRTRLAKVMEELCGVL